MPSKEIAMSSANRVVHHGKFIIEATAEEREGLWFPSYQILTDGQVATPWQALNVAGLQSEELALDVAVERAIDDVNRGLTSIFS